MKRIRKAEVVGLDKYDFTSPDGARLTGSVLYVMYNRDGVDGTACGRITAPVTAGKFALGDSVLVLDGAKLELALVENNG